MISDKKLKAYFDKVKKVDQYGHYYDFDEFKQDAKDFIKAIKRREVVASMHVSQSGMTRKFNSVSFNMLWNICYNQKMSWDVVKVYGCGMDMWWNLNYITCQILMTKGEIEKYRINSLCSQQRII